MDAVRKTVQEALKILSPLSRSMSVPRDNKYTLSTSLRTAVYIIASTEQRIKLLFAQCGTTPAVITIF